MMSKRWVVSLVVSVAAVAAACQSSAPAGAPATEPTPAQSGVSTPAPTAESLGTAAPTSTPSPTLDGIRRLTDEELAEELKFARFSTRSWSKTDFRIHSVPLREFEGGGPPKDGIPSIDRPQFQPVSEANRWMFDREPVQVVNINGDARAYPLHILIWHEIVNDTVGGEPVAVTY